MSGYYEVYEGLEKVANAINNVASEMAARNKIEERKLQLRIAELEQRGVLPSPAKNAKEPKNEKQI